MSNQEFDKRKPSVPSAPHPLNSLIGGLEAGGGMLHTIGGITLAGTAAIVGDADRVIQMQPWVDKKTIETMGTRMPFITEEVTFLRNDMGLSPELSITGVMLTGVLLLADAIRRFRNVERYARYIRNRTTR